MHPILRITIGCVIAVCRILQPAHGFTAPVSRYHDYNNPLLYSWFNIVNAAFYAAAIMLIASGIWRVSAARFRRG